jgi:hypothetical protein
MKKAALPPQKNQVYRLTKASLCRGSFCFTHAIRIHPTVFIRLESPNFQSMPKRFENRKAASGLRYPNRVFLRGTAPQ